MHLSDHAVVTTLVNKKDISESKSYSHHILTTIVIRSKLQPPKSKKVYNLLLDTTHCTCSGLTTPTLLLKA